MHIPKEPTSNIPKANAREPARDQQIIAAPALIKQLPLRRLVGCLSKEDRVLAGLDLSPKPLTN